MGKGSEETFSPRRYNCVQQICKKVLNTIHWRNTNQKHNEITTYQLRWLLSKRQNIGGLKKRV